MITRRNLLVRGAGFAGLAALPGARIVRAQDRTILRARLQRDIQVLDPGYMVGGSEIVVQFATMPRLAHIVEEGGVFGWTPTEYMERLEGVDPTHIEFELKPGFQWTNDYGEVTAEDVKYSFERLLDSDWKDRWLALDGIEVTGTYAGRITLKHPAPAIWLTSITAGSGCLVCKAATEAVGGQYTTEIPATCGPYVISEWIPKQRLVLTANPDWPGSAVAFDEIQFINVEDHSAAELAYEAGELDISSIPADAIGRYEENPPPDTEVEIAGYLQYAWLGMNTEHEKLQDIRVRQAIQRAIDVDSIIEAAYFGVAEKAYGILPPGLPGKRNQAAYSYDPDAARALIEEAGASGLELELKTLNQRDRIVTAQIIQANLQAIGVNITIIPLDSGPFWNLGQESKGDDWMDSQLWIMRFGGLLDPATYFQWFTRDQIGIWNWERWTSDEFETLYQDVATETDAARRAEMLVRMQEIMEETGAYVWLGHEPEAFIHRSAIAPVITPDGEYDFPKFMSA